MRHRLAALLQLCCACWLLAAVQLQALSSAAPPGSTGQSLCVQSREARGRDTAPQTCVDLGSDDLLRTGAVDAAAHNCGLEIVDFLCDAADAPCTRLTADGRTVGRRAVDTPCLRQACQVRAAC